MDEIKARNQRYELITWGGLFLWAGLRDLIPGLPNGTGLLGVAAILLGLNAARRLGDLPMSAVSTALGAMALALGGVVLFFSLEGMRVDLPFFPVLLVVIGVSVLAHGTRHWNRPALRRE